MAITTARMTKKSIGPWAAFMQQSWVYPVALALLAIVVFSGFLFSDKMLYSSDQLGGLDSKVFLHNSFVKHHQLPFWFNPRLGGMPTIDALFGDIFYPFSIIINSLFPVAKAIGLKMVFHVFLAGFFFFLMLRRGFKVAAPLAFFGGVFYMFNPEFFTHIYPGHDGKMYVIAWIPFMVWQLKALADAPSLLKASLVGLGIGMSLLTSHVQLTYFVLWGLFLYSVFAVILLLVKKENSAAFKFGAYFVLAVAIGLAIGFIQLYPSFMYIHDAYSVRGAGRGFEYASSWSLHWPEFFSLWVPEFVGNTWIHLNPAINTYWSENAFKLNSEYAGGIVLLLSVIALVWKPKPWRFLWAGVALFAVLYSMGAHTPVFYLAYYIIPGVKKFRACSMIMCWFSFSTILLAALFLKDILKGELGALPEKRKKRWTRGLSIAIACLFLVVALFSMKEALAGIFPFISSLDTRKHQFFDQNFSQNFVPMLWLWFFFAATCIGLIIAALNGKVKPGIVVAVIGIIGAIDILRVDVPFITLIDPRPYFYADPGLDNLREEMNTAPFRVFALPGALQQNGEGVQGLEGVGGFHDNELRWYRDFRGNQDDRNYFDKLVDYSGKDGPSLIEEQLRKGNAFLDVANAKYLLGRTEAGLVAIENRNALGRVSFAPNFVIMDSSKIVPALQSGGYDYRTTVALLAPPSLKPAANMDDSSAQRLPPFTALWQRYTPNDRIVKVHAPAEGFMRIAEVYYPGWKVSIDGKPAPVYRSDLAWMAVYMPKGEHTVALGANSLYFAKAAKVTFGIALALCFFWAISGYLALMRRSTVQRENIPGQAL
jgi:hypothetical protein